MTWTVETLNDTVDEELAALPDDSEEDAEDAEQ